MPASQLTWSAGQTLDPWAVNFLKPDGVTPDNLTNVTGLTLLLLNQATGKTVTGIGLFTAINQAQGQYTYAPNQADTAVPGVYLIKVRATWPTVAGVIQEKDYILGTITVIPA